MLLTSTGVISRSQQEESVLLLRKIEELNKNTARLIVEAGKLIQESNCTATMMCGLLRWLSVLVVISGTFPLQQKNSA